MQNLEEAIVRRMARAKQRLAVAESCTGGLIGHRITRVPGASEMFSGGVIAYSNAVKAGLLGVSEKDLGAQGAVSEAVARQMAEGVRARLDSDYAVAATGIAGPGGGTAEKPVGLVHVAVAGPGETVARKRQFEGNRNEITEQTAATALALLWEQLDQ